MADYIDLASFKARHGITITTNDVRIAQHITAASRRVDAITGRQFGSHSGAATVRYFRAATTHLLYIDDAYDISTVEADEDDDGTYERTWATTDYETDPANGIGPDGQSGWPTYQLRAVDDLRFPTSGKRRQVKVTAKWGWSAVPADVIEATHLLAHRLYFEVAVPGGVTPANLDFGLPGSPLQRPYTAEGLLVPFVRPDRVVAVA